MRAKGATRIVSKPRGDFMLPCDHKPNVLSPSRIPIDKPTSGSALAFVADMATDNELKVVTSDVADT